MEGFILLDVFDLISKIANPFALLGLLGLLGYWFYNQIKNKQIDTKLSLAFSSLIVVLAVIGGMNHYFDYSKYKKENEELKSKYEKTVGEKEKVFAERERLRSDKDSCHSLKKKLEMKIDNLSEKLVKNEKELVKEMDKKEGYKSELRKYKSVAYGKTDKLFTPRRDSDTGLWGYQKKGQPIETVEFIYRDACGFKCGRAGVKNARGKWGYVDHSLGESPLIPFIYDEVFAFYQDKAKVLYKGKWMIIDKSGNKIKELDNGIVKN